MIDAVKAIEKIKNHLKTQIDNGTLNGTYQESTTSISFYVYKTPNTTEPLLTLRVTDHRPDLQKYIRPNAPRPSIEPNTNMSVEFYIPKTDIRGNIKQNKFRNKVLSPSNISVVQPFSVSSYNYDSRKLDIGDDDIILNAVMDWIQNSQGKYPYKDPFENTPKAAKELTKIAKVSIIGKNAVDTNISKGKYGADDVSESRNNNKTDKNESKNMTKKNTIRLTESELKKIITESVKNILRESNLQEGGFGNFMNRTFKGSKVNSIYQKYLSAWQSSYAPALKQLDAISLQRQQNNGIARASASFTDYYTSPITQCLNELQGGNLNITATIDRHFASIAKKCQQYGVQIPRTKSTAQPAQGGQQTASNRQQPTQGGQQTNQETLNSWIDYAKELAKELKLWQAGRGGENCYDELKETITLVSTKNL